MNKYTSILTLLIVLGFNFNSHSQTDLEVCLKELNKFTKETYKLEQKDFLSILYKEFKENYSEYIKQLDNQDAEGSIVVPIYEVPVEIGFNGSSEKEQLRQLIKSSYNKEIDMIKSNQLAYFYFKGYDGRVYDLAELCIINYFEKDGFKFEEFFVDDDLIALKIEYETPKNSKLLTAKLKDIDLINVELIDPKGYWKRGLAFEHKTPRTLYLKVSENKCGSINLRFEDINDEFPIVVGYKEKTKTAVEKVKQEKKYYPKPSSVSLLPTKNNPHDGETNGWVKVTGTMKYFVEGNRVYYELCCTVQETRGITHGDDCIKVLLYTAPNDVKIAGLPHPDNSNELVQKVDYGQIFVLNQEGHSNGFRAEERSAIHIGKFLVQGDCQGSDIGCSGIKSVDYYSQAFPISIIATKEVSVERTVREKCEL